MLDDMMPSGEDWIGDIPKDWSVSRIQNFLYEINVKNSPIKTNNILSLTNTDGVIPYSERGNQGNRAKENLEDYKVVYPNTIVANSMNILIGSVGLSKYEGCVSPVYYVYGAKPQNDIRFFSYIFSSTQFQKELRKYANGILEIRMRVSSSNILKRKVAIPPEGKQTKIADWLDEEIKKIDELIKSAQNSLSDYSDLKNAIIFECVTKGLNPNCEFVDSGISFIGNIPKHWELTRLRNIGTPQNGISKGGEFFGKGYPFVSYGDVYRNYSLPDTVEGKIESTQTEREKYSVCRGDIFFTRTSETIEEVGFSSVCEKTIPDATFAGFLIRVRPFNDCLLPEFSKYYFRSPQHRYYLAKEMNIVTRASLGQTLLKNMPVLIPPKEEQRLIAKYLEDKCAEIDMIIREKEALIKDLEEYKKSLIFEVVTGKRKVV